MHRLGEKLSTAFKSAGVKGTAHSLRHTSATLWDTTGPMGEFVFNILVAAAELERATIKQRIQAGVDHAKAHGTKSGKAIGRPKRNIDFNKVLEAYQLGHGNYSAAARFLTEKTGQKVAPGYVWNIIQHRAQELGVEVQELVSISQEISTERRS